MESGLKTGMINQLQLEKRKKGEDKKRYYIFLVVVIIPDNESY